MVPITRKALSSLIAVALFAGANALAQDDAKDADAKKDDAAAPAAAEAAPVPAITWTDAPIDGDLAKLAEDAATGDWNVRRAALDTLSKQYGGRGVAALLRWVGSNSDNDVRAQGVMALKRLGSDSVAAMIAGLASKDAMVRRNLVITLGQVNAHDAAAALAAVAQHDEDPIARDEASKALALIAPGSSGSAAGALLTAANECLSGGRPQPAGADGKVHVYFWNGHRVMDRDATPNLVNAANAKMYAEWALMLDGGNLAAQQSLTQAYEALNKVIRGGGDVVGPAGWDKALPRLEDLLRLGGAQIDVPAVDAPKPETVNGAADLVANSGDKRLRYMSALALAGSPSPQIVATLGEALSESATRQVLVIDPDAVERNSIVAATHSLRVVAIAAETGAMGLVRAKESPIKDAVIIRTTVSDIKADRIIENLRRDVRTATLPIILIVDEADRDRMQSLFGDKVAAIVPAPVKSGAILKPAFDAAFEKAQLNDERMEAEQFSRRAALALAAMDGSVLAPAGAALIAAIPREDAVRIPAMVALSKLGEAGGEAPALALLRDGAASKEARAAAAYALRGILSKNAGSPDTLRALEKMVKTGDAAIRADATNALGGARGLAPENRTALLLDLSLPF